MTLSLAFVFAYFNLICGKPLFLETPFLRSQAFIQHSQGQDSQPLSYAIEHEESISKESNETSDENGILESPTAHDRSQAFNHHLQGQDSLSLSDAIEPEESISQDSNITSNENGSLESPTVHNRIARSAYPCVSKVVRAFDSCRNLWVNKVECKGRHPACNHVIPIHRVPKCNTVYGFRETAFVSKSSALPIDCQCAS